jgi:hypothetical protein
MPRLPARSRKRKSLEDNSELENNSLDSANSTSATPSQLRHKKTWCDDNPNNWTAKRLVEELNLCGFNVPPSLCNKKKVLHQMYIANQGRTVPGIPLGVPQAPVANADHIPAEIQRFNDISQGQVSVPISQTRSAATGVRQPPQETTANATCISAMDQAVLDIPCTSTQTQFRSDVDLADHADSSQTFPRPTPQAQVSSALPAMDSTVFHHGQPGLFTATSQSQMGAQGAPPTSTSAVNHPVGPLPLPVESNMAASREMRHDPKLVQLEVQLSQVQQTLKSLSERLITPPSHHTASMHSYTTTSSATAGFQGHNLGQLMTPASTGLYTQQQEQYGAFGILPDSVSHQDPVSPSLRQAILAGKDINLSMLLIHDYEYGEVRSVEPGEQIIRLKQSDKYLLKH